MKEQVLELLPEIKDIQEARDAFTSVATLADYVRAHREGS